MTQYTHIDEAEANAHNAVSSIHPDNPHYWYGLAMTEMLSGIGRELADGLESIRAEIRRTNLGRKK